MDIQDNATTFDINSKTAAVVVRGLYIRGYRGDEIARKLHIGVADTERVVADAVEADTQVEIDHYRNRATSPVGNARLINEDAHYELVDRFN